MFETQSNENHNALSLPRGLSPENVHNSVETVEHNMVANSGLKPKKKSLIWYVIYIFTTRENETLLSHKTIHHAWAVAQSKFAAKIIARELIGKGFQIVDIVQGTKTHITHKYLGLDI
jgi:hypothetical protein